VNQVKDIEPKSDPWGTPLSVNILITINVSKMSHLAGTLKKEYIEIKEKKKKINESSDDF